MSLASDSRSTSKVDYDVIIVGAGFAGLYALYKLRKEGYSARVYEAGTGVGGKTSEIEGRCGGLLTAIKTTLPDWITEKKFVVPIIAPASARH